MLIKKKIEQSVKNFLKIIFFIEICYFYSYIASISYRVYLKFMSILINYKNSSYNRNSSNLILFVDEKFNISPIRKHLSTHENSFVSDLIKAKDIKNNILAFDISSKRKIILISLKRDNKPADIENLGAKFYDKFKSFNQSEYSLNSESISSKLKNIVGYFLHGVKLKSYKFDKYLTKKNKTNISIIVTGKNKPSNLEQIKFSAIEKGTFYTRDLVSEPGNVLHPDEYAKRLNSLKKIGLKVKIYKKICDNNQNCNTQLMSTTLENEIKLAVLKKAAKIQKADAAKNAKDNPYQVVPTDNKKN